MAPELSVVVPTHNRRERLRACLESLARQTAPADAFEVIVAVDGSTDGTEEMLAALETPFPLRVVAQAATGPGAARNLGAAAAGGRCLLFLDDDMVASPDLVTAHLEAQRAGDEVACIGRIEPAPPGRADRLARKRARDLAAHHEALAHRPPTLRDARCGNLSLPRAAFRRVGGIAEDVAVENDVELALRLQEGGVSFRYLAQAVCTEGSRGDWRRIVRQEVQRGASGVELYRRRPSILPWLELGGRADVGRASAAMRELLLALRLPAALVARMAMLVPGEGASRVALDIACHYAYWSGVRRAADRDAWSRLRRGVPILMYHAVAARGEPPSRFVVPVRRLERQLRWLARRGYTALSMEEYLRLRAEFRLPPARSVVITFDDGYRDNVELALPILERLGQRATVFLTTALGERRRSGDPALDGRPLLALEEARALLGGSLSFGAHSRTHPRLAEIPVEDVEREVAGSKSELEAALGVPVPAFAYPYGSFDDRVRQAVAATGFLGAVSVISGRNRPATDSFALRRIEICGTDRLLHFVLAMAGAPRAGRPKG